MRRPASLRSRRSLRSLVLLLVAVIVWPHAATAQAAGASTPSSIWSEVKKSVCMNDRATRRLAIQAINSATSPPMMPFNVPSIR